MAIAFAKEGADVAIVYLEEHKDAKETQHLVQEHERKCLLIDGDVGDQKFCQKAGKQTIDEFGKIDILVNNAAEQHRRDSIEKITEQQLERTFRTNIFSFFFITKAAMKHQKKPARLLTRRQLRHTKGARSCSIIHQPRMRSLPLPVRFRRRSLTKAFA